MYLPRYVSQVCATILPPKLVSIKGNRNTSGKFNNVTAIFKLIQSTLKVQTKRKLVQSTLKSLDREEAENDTCLRYGSYKPFSSISDSPAEQLNV